MLYKHPQAEFAYPKLVEEISWGDAGRGVGASHQTGWTGLLAVLLGDACRERADDEGPHAHGAAVGPHRGAVGVASATT